MALLAVTAVAETAEALAEAGLELQAAKKSLPFPVDPQ